MNLKTIIEDTDTLPGKIFDVVIVLSLVSFSIETLPDLGENAQFWLYVVEIVSVSLFTLEYGLRLLVADSRLGYVFSFYGMLDLCAILPFYISTGVDLRSARAFRLLRFIRIFKFTRYTEAVSRFRNAFAEIREELILFGIVTGMLIFLSSVGIYYFERDAQPDQFASIFHCLWWSIITLTTVGYGDVYPITIGGRVFTGIILIIGLGIVAVPTGLFAAALMKTREKHLEVVCNTVRRRAPSPPIQRITIPFRIHGCGSHISSHA